MTKALALRMTALTTMWLIPACSGSDSDPSPVPDPGTNSSAATPAGSGLEVERFEVGDEGIRVSGLLVAETGTVVVAVPGQDQIRLLDPGDGSVEAVSTSPGGANFLSRMGLSDGTFWTTDQNHRELVRFSLEGDELARTEIDFRRQEGAARARGLLGILPCGRLVVDTQADGFGIAAHGSPIDPRFRPGSAIETLPVWTMEPDGSGPVTLATLTTLTRFWLLEQIFPEGPRRRGIHVRQEPFEAYPLIAVSPSGNHIALVDRFPPDGEGPFEYMIHRLSPEGDTTTTERHGYDPVEIRDSWVEAAVQEAVQDLDHVSAPEKSTSISPHGVPSEWGTTGRSGSSARPFPRAGHGLGM